MSGDSPDTLDTTPPPPPPDPPSAAGDAMVESSEQESAPPEAPSSGAGDVMTSSVDAGDEEATEPPEEPGAGSAMVEAAEASPEGSGDEAKTPETEAEVVEQPAGEQSAEEQPVGEQSVGEQPADDPVATGDDDTVPVEGDPVETDPVGTDPVEADPVEADPTGAEDESTEVAESESPAVDDQAVAAEVEDVEESPGEQPAEDPVATGEDEDDHVETETETAEAEAEAEATADADAEAAKAAESDDDEADRVEGQASADEDGEGEAEVEKPHEDALKAEDQAFQDNYYLREGEPVRRDAYAQDADGNRIPQMRSAEEDWYVPVDSDVQRASFIGDVERYSATPEDKQELQDVVDARSDALAALQEAKVDPNTPEDDLKNAYTAVRDIGEELGHRAGTLAVENVYGGEGVAITPLHEEGDRGSGRFDQVWKVTDQEGGDRFVVVECKGGDGPLGTRRNSGLPVEQGTPEYFDSIVGEMRKHGPSGAALADDLVTARFDGDVDFILVRASTVPGDNGAEFGGYALRRFDIDTFGSQ